MNSNKKSDILPPESPSDYSKIYVFKILINHGHTVPIWRTVEVPENYSFYDLHVAIQDSMGWLDYRLHRFDMMNPITERMKWIGIPHDALSKDIVPEKTAFIADYFTLSNATCEYEYDFSQPWNFLITLEGILQKVQNFTYPRCTAGNCHSPPEDCRNVSSYMNWVQKPFDIKNIIFRDPAVAWEDACQGF